MKLLVVLLIGWPLHARGQLASPHDEARKVLAEAISLDKEGKKGEADAAFRNAIRLNSQFGKAYERYSLFLYAQGKWDKGVALMKRAIKALPGSVALRGYLGTHLYRLGKIRRAHEEFVAAEKELQGRYELQVVFAQVARVMGDYPGAVRAINDYLRTRPKNLAKQDYVFETQVAEALINQGKSGLPKAAKLLRSVLKGNIYYRPARVARALWLLRKGHCKRAVRAYKQLFRRKKAKKENQEKAIRLAEAYFCLKRDKEAHETTTRYLADHRKELGLLMSNPKSKAVYPVLAEPLKTAVLLSGDSLMRQGRTADALRDYRDALKLYENALPVFLRVARAYYQTKQYGQVLALVEPELRKADVPAPVVVFGLRAYIRTKRDARALAMANMLLQRKQLTKEQRYYIGIAFNSNGKFARGAEVLEQADVAQPKVKKELARAYTYLALRALKKGERPQALALMKRALRHGDKNLIVHRNLALFYLSRDAGAQALKHAEAMLTLKKDDPMAHELAGRALALQGKHGKALNHFNVALKAFKGIKKGPHKQKASLLATMAVSQLRTGEVDSGMRNLQQASSLAKGDKALSGLVARNAVRAHLLRGEHYLARENSSRAWDELNIALRRSSVLDVKERQVLRIMVALAAIAAGRIPQAKRMIQQNRAQLPKVLKAPYNRIGYPLLMAYADSFSRSPRLVRRAADRINALARRTPAAKSKLTPLAGALYMKLASQLYRRGQTRAAIGMINRARALVGRLRSVMRHNLAVAEYYSGSQQGALKTLQALQRAEPISLCNQAVHFENAGNVPRAHQLFSDCLRKGGRFPNLKSIVAVKDAIFGKK